MTSLLAPSSAKVRRSPRRTLSADTISAASCSPPDGGTRRSLPHRFKFLNSPEQRWHRPRCSSQARDSAASNPGSAVPVRPHSACLTGNVLNSRRLRGPASARSAVVRRARRWHHSLSGSGSPPAWSRQTRCEHISRRTTASTRSSPTEAVQCRQPPL